MSNNLSVLFVLSVLLSACGPSEETASKLSEKATRSESTFLDSQLDTLEKAQDVEKALQDSMNDRDKEMQEKGI